MKKNKIVPDFSIPFNGDFDLLEEALRSGYISEVYFSIFTKEELACNNYGVSENPTIKNNLDLQKLSGLCSEYGVGLNLLCNSPSLFYKDLNKLFSQIKTVKNLTAVTVSDTLALPYFVKEFPNINIQASFIMNLDSVSKIKQFLSMGGGSVVLPGKFSRDKKLLSELKKLKKQFPKFRTKLIANLDCVCDCIFLPMHYMIGFLRNFKRDDAKLYPDKLCYRDMSPEDFIKVPFIRPEDLAYYRKNKFVDCFKLIYRSSPSSMLRQVYKSYFSESHNGNLFDIIPSKSESYEDARHVYPGNLQGKNRNIYCDNSSFPKNFLLKVMCCSKECELCDYCKKVAIKTKTKINLS